MILTLLRFGLFMLSNLGYWEFFRKKYKINVYFLPVFTIALQFLILFLGGLLNLLGESANLIFLLGLLFLLQALRKEKFQFLKPYLNWGYGFLLLATVLIALAVRGSLFVHYDNFSHWAIVVKKMLETNRFPNFTDEVIGFQNYPLGSAAYIYYFSKITSSSEDFQMLAQAFMMLCTILPWFSYVRKNGLLCTILITLMTNFMLCYNIQLCDLLVDTLLPLAGMATILFVYHICLRKTEEPVCVLCTIPLLCWTAQIKNSGLLFALMASAMILVSLKGSKQTVRKLAAAASPLLGFLLWNRHCGYVFAQSSISKHAMTADNFSLTVSQKSAEDIQTIVKGVAEYSLTRSGLRWALLWLLVLGIVTFLLCKAYRKQYLRLLAFTAGMYVVYLIGIGGMYIFSMPTHEALILGSIERYLRTLDIAAYYLLIVYGISLLSELENIRRYLPVGVVLVALMLGTWKTGLGRFKTVFEQPGAASRMQFQCVIEDYGVPADYSYFICLAEEDSGYYYFLCSYFLDERPYAAVITDASQFDTIGEYSFLMNFDEDNPIIREWLQENHPDQADKQVINLF